MLIDFASHGYELAVLEEVAEDMPEKFTTIEGVKLGWPEYEEGTEHLHYSPARTGKAEGDGRTALLHDLENAQSRPPRRSPARSKRRLGKATVETEGSLPRISPPIDEEAEEEVQEEEEETEEASGESEEAEGE